MHMSCFSRLISKSRCRACLSYPCWQEGVHSWSCMRLVEKAIPFLGYADRLEEGNRAKYGLRPMWVFLAGEHFRFKYVSWCLRVIIIETGWGHGINPLMQYTPAAFFSVEFVTKYGWVCGVLFPELGFATLAQCFRCHWIHFVKETFSDLCPEISSSKMGGQFCLARLKAFGIHLDFGCKTALWTILIQASLCDRMSIGAWKLDWNLILSWISGGARRACCDVSAGFLFDCKKNAQRNFAQNMATHLVTLSMAT